MSVWENEDSEDSEDSDDDDEVEPPPEDWEALFLERWSALERFLIADYDYDYECFEDGDARPKGTVEFVVPTQQGEEEMAPEMLERLEVLQKSGKVRVKGELKEVKRGGKLIEIT